MQQHEDKLKTNQRLKFVYPTWHKMELKKRQEILNQAQIYLEKLKHNQL